MEKRGAIRRGREKEDRAGKKVPSLGDRQRGGRGRGVLGGAMGRCQQLHGETGRAAGRAGRQA